MLYLDWEKNIKKMSTEEKALFLDMMYDAYNRREIQDIPDDYIVLGVMWDSIYYSIQNNLSKYDDKIETVSIQSQDSTVTKDKAKAKEQAKEQAKDQVQEKVNVQVKVRSLVSEEEASSYIKQRVNQ